jgi:hypothetical protein
MIMRRLSLIFIPAVAATLYGQAPIPIRTLGPILATSAENVGQAVSVRGTSDGHVLVGAASRQRLYEFDSTLRTFTMVVDSGTGTGVTSFRTTGLIPYRGDSTLMVDFGATALIVLDATGKQIRSMAPPHAADLTFLGAPAAYGHPAFDAKGRIVYRSALGTTTKAQPHGAPLLRGDFETRTVDTLAWLNVSNPGALDLSMKENPAGGPPLRELKMILNPFPTFDEWAMLSDGTIAIVRVHDYHIDWIDPDGSQRTTPKMALDWRRYSDGEKQQIVDSARRSVQESLSNWTSGRGGLPPATLIITIVPDSEFPSFWPPIRPGSVLADLDDHLWILPTTSTNSANGFTYDVVDRNGTLLERVQLPKDRVVVGFGARGMVYMTRTVGAVTYLERAVLR